MRHATAALFLILSLLVMNISSVAHADCTEGLICDDRQAVQSEDHPDGHADTSSSVCDCCACGHHHHSHTVLPEVKAELQLLDSRMRHDWDRNSYFSFSYYPPSRPPRA